MMYKKNLGKRCLIKGLEIIESSDLSYILLVVVKEDRKYYYLQDKERRIYRIVKSKVILY